MGVAMDIVAVIAQVDPGEMFGWVQAILEQLGVWYYIQMAVVVMIVLAVTGAFLRFFGRG